MSEQFLEVIQQIFHIYCDPKSQAIDPKQFILFISDSQLGNREFALKIYKIASNKYPNYNGGKGELMLNGFQFSLDQIAKKYYSMSYNCYTEILNNHLIPLLTTFGLLPSGESIIPELVEYMSGYRSALELIFDHYKTFIVYEDFQIFLINFEYIPLHLTIREAKSIFNKAMKLNILSLPNLKNGLDFQHFLISLVYLGLLIYGRSVYKNRDDLSSPKAKINFLLEKIKYQYRKNFKLQMISNRNRSVENELDTKIENYNQIKENLIMDSYKQEYLDKHITEMNKFLQSSKPTIPDPPKIINNPNAPTFREPVYWSGDLVDTYIDSYTNVCLEKSPAKIKASPLKEDCSIYNKEISINTMNEALNKSVKLLEEIRRKKIYSEY